MVFVTGELVEYILRRVRDARTKTICARDIIMHSKYLFSKNEEWQMRLAQYRNSLKNIYTHTHVIHWNIIGCRCLCLFAPSLCLKVGCVHCVCVCALQSHFFLFKLHFQGSSFTLTMHTLYAHCKHWNTPLYSMNDMMTINKSHSNVFIGMWWVKYEQTIFCKHFKS